MVSGPLETASFETEAAAAYACRPNVIRRGFQQTRANELRWTR
jgi:hypothetical protein